MNYNEINAPVIEAPKKGKALVICDLLSKGWASYLDMAIAINNIEKRYDPLKHGKGVIYYATYLWGKKIDCHIFNNNDAKDQLDKTKKLWAFVREMSISPLSDEVSKKFIQSLEIRFKGVNPKNIEEIEKSDLLCDGKIMVYYREPSRKKINKTEDPENIEVLRKIEKIESESDRVVSQFKLSPETIEYINYIRELKKADIREKTDTEDSKKIKNKYNIKIENREKALIKARGLTTFYIYKFVDPNYSFMEDWAVFNSLKKATREGMANVEESMHSSLIPSFSSADYRKIDIKSYHRIKVKESLNSIEELNKHIDDLETFKPRGWVVGKRKGYEAILTEVNNIKTCSGEIDESFVNGIIEGYSTHLLSHIEPNMLPRDIISFKESGINLDIDTEYSKAKEKFYKQLDEAELMLMREQRYSFDTGYKFSNNIKELIELLEKGDLSDKEIERIEGLCNLGEYSDWYFIERLPIGTLRSVLQAVYAIKVSIPYVRVVQKTIVAITKYEYNHILEINEILNPIFCEIASAGNFCGIFWDEFGRFESRVAREKLASKCKSFLQDTERKEFKDIIMVCVVGILLAELEDDYSDPYNINSFINSIDITNLPVVEIENAFVKEFEEYEDKNYEGIEWILRYRFEQKREELYKNYIWNSNMGINTCNKIIPLLRDLFCLIDIMYLDLAFFFDYNCRKELSIDLDNLIYKLKNCKEKKDVSTEVEKIIYFIKTIQSSLLSEYDIQEGALLCESKRKSISTCKEIVIQTIKEANDFAFDEGILQMIYYRISFVFILLIKKSIDDNLIKEDDSLEAFNWIKVKVIDKIEWVEVRDRLYKYIDEGPDVYLLTFKKKGAKR